MRDDDELSPLIGRIAESLRRPVPLAADFDARVMVRVRATTRRSAAGRIVDWLWEPRPVFLSPLAGLSLAAGIALLLVAAGSAVFFAGRSAAPAQGSLSSGPSPVPRAPSPVQFVLLAPQAHTVALAGDFNRWDPGHTPLARTPSGMWTAQVPLAPGRYTYVFVVDGRRFVPDPAAPRAVGDDFGTPSSVVTVASRGGS